MAKKKKNKDKQTVRAKLINAIINLAVDEFETSDDILKLAKESEEELIDRLINIAYYAM